MCTTFSSDGSFGIGALMSEIMTTTLTRLRRLPLISVAAIGKRSSTNVLLMVIVAM